MSYHYQRFQICELNMSLISNDLTAQRTLIIGTTHLGWADNHVYSIMLSQLKMCSYMKNKCE